MWAFDIVTAKQSSWCICSKKDVLVFAFGAIIPKQSRQETAQESMQN
jgi:hypothetical protein